MWRRVLVKHLKTRYQSAVLLNIDKGESVHKIFVNNNNNNIINICSVHLVTIPHPSLLMTRFCVYMKEINKPRINTNLQRALSVVTTDGVQFVS